MIVFKKGISKKEKTTIISTLFELVDVYRDFYITKNNLRLFIKDNIDVLFECLKEGDYVAYDDDGIAIVTGFSDNAPRKYLKVLTKNNINIERYIKIITWNLNCDLYVKVKKTNPIKLELEKLGFIFKGGRGAEVLLVKQKGDKNVSRYKN